MHDCAANRHTDHIQYIAKQTDCDAVLSRGQEGCKVQEKRMIFSQSIILNGGGDVQPSLCEKKNTNKEKKKQADLAGHKPACCGDA